MSIVKVAFSGFDSLPARSFAFAVISYSPSESSLSSPA